MKCPRCGALYRDGSARCADCGARLRSVLRGRQSSPGADGDGPANPRPLGLPPGATDPACAFLTGSGVRLWRRDAGDGTFRRVYLGFSWYGDDFYVDAREYPRALTLLETYELSSGGAPAEREELPAKRRGFARRRAVRVLAAALAVLLALALFAQRLPFILGV